MSYILGIKKSSTTLLMNDRVLHYTYDRGSLFLFKSTFVYKFMLMTIYECKFFYVYILSLGPGIRGTQVKSSIRMNKTQESSK